jgi:hypothetical protein
MAEPINNILQYPYLNKVKMSEFPTLDVPLTDEYYFPILDSHSINNVVINQKTQIGNLLGYISSSLEGNYVTVPPNVNSDATASYALNSLTASHALNVPIIDNSFTSSFVTTSSFNSFTSSILTTSSLNNFTSSFVTTSSFNSFTSSILTTSSLNNFTSSFVTTSSFNSFTSSINNLTDGFVVTASTAITNETASYALTASYIEYNTLLNDSLEMIDDVGGLLAGTTVSDLKGKSIIQIFDDLLFPTINPTFINPSLTFTENINNILEISSSADITFTSTFNRGQILIGSSEQNKRSGLPNTYNYTGTGLPTVNSNILLTDIYTVTDYIVLIGNQSWTSYVSYDVGSQPLDNKGNVFSTPLSAGNTSTSTITIEGAYPIFATTSNITTLTKQPLVSMISGNNIVISLVSESGINKQTFEIPDNWLFSPTNRPLIGIETLNTISGLYEYQGGNSSNSLTFWNISNVSETVQSNIIPYKRYIYNGVLRGAITIRLKF